MIAKPRLRGGVRCNGVHRESFCGRGYRKAKGDEPGDHPDAAQLALHSLQGASCRG